MSSATLYIVYDGPALATHEMDVRELAPALLALSDMFEEANAALNGEKAKISLNVKGSFKTGCFGIDLTVAQSVLQSLINFGTSTEVQSAAAITSILGFGVGSAVKSSVLSAIKWIRGRKIDKITVEGSIATLHIGDDFLEIEERILRLLQNERIRRAIQDAIQKPLECEGVESFGFTDKHGEKIEIITKGDAAYYTAPKPHAEDLGETTYETTLQIIGITFQEKNKWRFSDGTSTSFYAEMLDSGFMSRVDNHSIMFGKGDIIRAMVREKKVLDTTGTMRAERSILHVFEHRNAAVQLKLIVE